MVKGECWMNKIYWFEFAGQGQLCLFSMFVWDCCELRKHEPCAKQRRRHVRISGRRIHRGLTLFYEIATIRDVLKE